MKTEVRKLDGLTIEEPILDDEGQRMRRLLTERIMREYEETGVLVDAILREEVTRYETDVTTHVVDEA